MQTASRYDAINAMGPAAHAADQRHNDDMHNEAVDHAITTRIEREIRPGAMPFDNSDAFPNPGVTPWLARQQIQGSWLPMLLANDDGGFPGQDG